ncbi:unnamed protein product [Ambrosiozyma monospora]|uniref:Unnamed protein product n=1 Tax=Ambrosiozyma monospora TaxID=43982 RepID=A0A9W6T098_AMBMO|nr:unnamed protein product [Ambrosiozyma monospora]
MSCWPIFDNSHGVHIQSSRSIRVQDPCHVGQFLIILMVSIFRVQNSANISEVSWCPYSEFKIHLMLANLNVCPSPPLLQAHSSSRSISCSPI